MRGDNSRPRAPAPGLATSPTGYLARVTPIEQILDVGLGRNDVDTHLLAGTVNAINDCVQACTTCADLGILDDEVADLRARIRVCLDTADIARAVSAVVSRRGAADRAVLMEVLEACVTTVVRCEEECARGSSNLPFRTEDA
jgi:hypothetical protein